MPDVTKCSDCGAEIPPGQPKGLCPRCALKGALELADDDSVSTAAMPVLPETGERIGRYKLLEKIGEGGCGVVYMAEQEEPVRRRVALKVIKPGMDTREVIARFEAERQALALMEHPHIAKIFDGGATDAGRPYFVMELVRGLRITEYCDQKRLSTRQRLDLFMQVCQAVQHAHQKGIIHRDLKPSNILVTVNDGVPVPKVIDFGIAKATGQRLTDKTLFTAFQQLIGTPAYMSPEQAEMTSLDIDTRSDIYSLGVLLYELLTGRTPFDTKELLRIGMEEMLRTIREQEPARPSARLSTLVAADLTTVARQRQTEAPKLIRLLRGDLDWIVMMCLEKDRARRYETANGLAMDIQRHLNNEPVLAGPPSKVYRFRKLVRRNKGLFAAAGAVVVGLATGGLIGPSVVSSVQVTAAVAMALFVGLAIAASLFVRESRARRRAVKAQAAEEQAHQETQDALNQMEITKAAECLSNDQGSTALAYLARVLREDDGNRVAAEMVLATLAYSGTALPLTETEPSKQESLVVSAEFSSDGQRLVTACFNQPASDWDKYTGFARVWDVRTGQALAQPIKHDGSVKFAQFSPDGQRLVTAYNEGTAAEGVKGSARVWDAYTGQPLTEPLKHNDEVNSVQFSSDGLRVVTASKDHTARVWDVRTGQALTELGHNAGVNSAQFSPDGRHVVTGCGDIGSGEGYARVWDAHTGQAVTQPLKHNNQVAFAQFSPDGQRVVTASWDKSARVWDAWTGQPLTEPLKHDHHVVSTRFSPDGQRIVTACGEGMVLKGYARVWDACTGEALTPPLKHEDAVDSAQFSPDGRRIVTTCHYLWSRESYARVWDARTGQPLTQPLQHNHRMNSARFSPDGQSVVTASGATARVWDARTGQALPATTKHDGQVLAFSMDGQLVAIGSMNWLRVWAVHTGQPLTGPLNHVGRVKSAWFSPDDRWVVSISTNFAQVWDVHTGQAQTEPIRHDTEVRFANFSPDSGRLVTASGTNAWLRSVHTGEPLTKPLKHDGEIQFAQFSSDGQRIVTACHLTEFHWEVRDARTGRARFVKGYAKVWDAQTGKPLTEPLEHDSCVNSAQFSPDGRRVVTACGDLVTRRGYARVWDAQKGQALTEPLGHNAVVKSAQFSPDGRRVVTACGYSMGYGQVWDSCTGQPLTEPLMHDGRMESAQFSPDSQRVLTACYDLDKHTGYARVWDARTGQALTKPLDEAGFAQFTPDGQDVLTALIDTTRVWNITAASPPIQSWLANLAEAVAGQRFNEKRMLEFVPESEFLRLKQKLANNSESDVCSRWAKWFLADRSTRSISPFSSITVPEYVQRRIEDNTEESLREATQLSPTNGLAFARLARQTLAQADNDNPRRIGEADFFSRRAIELSPNDPEVQRIRAEVAEQIKNAPKP